MPKSKKKQKPRPRSGGMPKEIQRFKNDLTNELMEKVAVSAFNQGFNEGVEESLKLIISLPMMVLRDYWWKKSYYTKNHEKIKKFVKQFFDYYHKWELGEITADTLDEVLKDVNVEFEEIALEQAQGLKL